MWKLNILTLILLSILVSINNGHMIKNVNDHEFDEHLNAAMMNYPDWVKENNLDPSPLLSTKFILQTSSSASNDVHVTCEISNQFIKGHSSGPAQVDALAVTNFTGHSFQIARYYGRKYEIHGQYNCSGEMNAFNYPELDEDLPFSGHGDFSLDIYQVREAVTLRNVGITEDLRFNLTYSWPTFGFMIDWRNNTQMNGQWNDELLNGNYLQDVENTFVALYVLQSLYVDTDIVQPGGHLLVRYLTQVLENVELKKVLSPENLPSPYVPTPRP